MLRFLLTPIVFAALLVPARAGDAPPAAAPVSTSAPAAAAPCECGGPGKCCGGGQMPAPLATSTDKPAGERSCGCGGAKKAGVPATKYGASPSRLTRG